MKDFLAGATGTTFGVISGIVSLFSFLPLYVMGLPIWAIVIILIALEFTMILQPILNLIAWVIGFFFVISGPQNWQSTVYYILFAMVICVCLFELIIFILSRNKKY